LAISDPIDDILAEQQICPRNLSVENGGSTYRVPSWLSGVGTLARRIGLSVSALALAPKLAALGITVPMLDLVEQEQDWRPRRTMGRSSAFSVAKKSTSAAGSAREITGAGETGSGPAGSSRSCSASQR
jgi:hypothetical protein